MFLYQRLTMVSDSCTCTHEVDDRLQLRQGGSRIGLSHKSTSDGFDDRMIIGLVCWEKSTGNHGFYHQIDGKTYYPLVIAMENPL